MLCLKPLSAAISETPMSNPDAEYEANYDAFIAEIKQTGEVWGLCTDEDDWAVCASSAYEDTDVMPFWSSEAAAQAQCVGEWEVFHAQAIPLEEFLIASFIFSISTTFSNNLLYLFIFAIIKTNLRFCSTNTYDLFLYFTKR